MNSDKQLTKTTNQWLIALLITSVIFVFFWNSKIKVENIGDVQFSQSLKDFNINILVCYDNIISNTIYDFIFIIAYSILFYFTYRVFQSSMRIPVSKVWIILCLIPGILDIMENIFLLILIDHSEFNGLFYAFWFVVRAKWTLAIPFLFINFTIFIYYVIRFINSFFS